MIFSMPKRTAKQYYPDNIADDSTTAIIGHILCPVPAMALVPAGLQEDAGHGDKGGQLHQRKLVYSK